MELHIATFQSSASPFESSLAAKSPTAKGTKSSVKPTQRRSAPSLRGRWPAARSDLHFPRQRRGWRGGGMFRSVPSKHDVSPAWIGRQEGENPTHPARATVLGVSPTQWALVSVSSSPPGARVTTKSIAPRADSATLCPGLSSAQRCGC